MIFSIDFECPECRTFQPQKLEELALGKRDSCAFCGAEMELGQKGLADLHQRLRETFQD